MADVVTTILVTISAGSWGAAGGFIYWALPKRPSGWIEFVKRLGAGYVAGSISNVLGGIQPFDSVGAWDTAGVTKLIVAGFAGLATIASFFQTELNENYRVMRAENRDMKTKLGVP